MKRRCVAAGHSRKCRCLTTPWVNSHLFTDLLPVHHQDSYLLALCNTPTQHTNHPHMQGGGGGACLSLGLT